MSQPTLYLGSDQYLWLLGLTDNTTGSYVTAATVTAAITDVAGASVASVSLTYQSGSQTVNGTVSAGGNYRGLLAHTVSLTAGQNYTVTVTVTSGSNQLTKVFTLLAVYDGLA